MNYVSDAVRRHEERLAREREESDERARQRVTSPNPATLDLDTFRRLNMTQRVDLRDRDEGTYRRLAALELGERPPEPEQPEPEPPPVPSKVTLSEFRQMDWERRGQLHRANPDIYGRLVRQDADAAERGQ